ncbi:MAG TPA: twin-arginine translocase TatA/TatE family subunit [Gemmatimonadaceae bacterium]|nr:twin-arginine translocase TatA/TatE family subunit [Gemmatimonadaceae bacterium]
MGFGNLGIGEILVILLVVLLLFGAKRIPEIAGSMGKGIREFKRSLTDVQESLSHPANDDRKERLRHAEPVEEPRVATDDEAHPEPKRLLS